MDPEEKQDAIKRYEDRLAKYGASVKTMGWRDERQQALRFKVLAEIGDLSGARILDVGCGFGDLYGFLQANQIEANYTGYDISARIIEAAREKFSMCEFHVKDILTDQITERFDYVFLSGVLNHRIADNVNFAQGMMAEMFDLADKGVACNMMSNYVDFEEEYLFYYSPETMFNFAKDLSRFVVLRHDYPLYEFTLYILKRD